MMDFDRTLLCPGRQIPTTDPINSAIKKSLNRILTLTNRKLTDIANFGLMDFKHEDYFFNPKEQFPGSMVVSLSLDQHPLTTLSHLVKNHKDYLVCLKSDGVRYLFAVLNTGHLVLIDRSLGLYDIQTTINGQALAETIVENIEIMHLLDGEIVKRISGMYMYHFQVFDVILIARQLTIEFDYGKRLTICNQFIEEASHASEFLKAKDNKSTESKEIMNEILVICKDFYRCKDTPFVLNELASLNIYDRQIDGLIFTKIKYPYIIGSSKGMLKWKPDRLNSIDFLAIENTRLNDKYGGIVTDADLHIIELYVLKNGGFMLFDYLFVFNNDDYLNFVALLNIMKVNNNDITGTILELTYDISYNSLNMTQIYSGLFDVDMDRIKELIKLSVIGNSFQNDTEACYALFTSLNRRVDMINNTVTGRWVLLRSRLDKALPNGYNTARNVCLSMFEEKISENTLIQSLKEVCK